MKKQILLLVLISLPLLLFGQKTKDLLGNCSVHDLEKEPYAAWYMTNYKAYEPNKEVSDRLTKVNVKNMR